MPAPLTHYYCAKRTLDILEKENLKLNKTAFLWGAQGPDIFFYHRFMPWNREKTLTEIGSRFHSSSPSQHFECAAKYIKSKGLSPHDHSYFLGNICHYAADRTCHPFVFAWEDIYRERESEKADFPWHSQIETSLDIIILRYETGKLPTDISLKECLPKDTATEQAIPAYWQSVTSDFFGVNISDKSAAYLPKDMVKMFGLMNNRLLLKKPFVEWGEKVAKKQGALSTHLMGISEGDVDYANTLNEVWDKKNNRNENFLNLFERAITDSVKLVKQCDNALKNSGSFLEITEDISYG